MENKKLGKSLIVIGILIAIVPMIGLSALAYYSMGSFATIASYLQWTLFIVGIIIAIFGEYLNRK
jgi:hypothetical protein